MDFKEGDLVKISRFGPIFFKDKIHLSGISIDSDMMPEYTSDNYKTVDKSDWLKERYKIIKIYYTVLPSNLPSNLPSKIHILSENGKYNFLTDSSGLKKLSILEMKF